MGRLVQGISQEDYDKLPPWRKFIIDHPITIGALFVLIMAGVYSIGTCFGLQ